MTKKRIPNLLDDVVERVIKPEPQGIRAYHGSPHDFDRFDLSKIGTGEGAQAYGHGLYFAENEGVARGYRDGLTPKFAQGLNEQIGKLGEELARADAALRKAPFGSDEARAAAKLINEIEAQRLPLIEQAKGRMYEVNIRANPDDFLDWDKPLAQQPRVSEILGLSTKSADDIHLEAQKLFDEAAARSGGQRTFHDYPDLATKYATLEKELDSLAPSVSGADFYRGTDQNNYLHSMLSGGNSDPFRSQELRDRGIPGIKYLDQGSRAAGEGSRNYVVFDDNLIDIIRKYGIVPGGLLGAGYAMAPSEAEAAPKVTMPRGQGMAMADTAMGALPQDTNRPEQSTLGKLYDAVTTNPIGTFKAFGSAIGDSVKDYAKSVYNEPSKGVADALELGVTSLGGLAPQAFWMATSPTEANAGEQTILDERIRRIAAQRGLLAD